MLSYSDFAILALFFFVFIKFMLQKLMALCQNLKITSFVSAELGILLSAA